MKNVVLLALAGCSWIGGERHEADLAVWAVQLTDAEIACDGGDELVVAALADIDDGVVLDARITVDDARATASATVSGGQITWTFTGLEIGDATQATLDLSGIDASRSEDLPLVRTGGGTFYADADDDGFGAGEAVLACAAPAGFVDNDEDCDDSDPAAGPPVQGFVDSDGDGAPGTAATACDAVAVATDCDDADPDRSPLLTESCNGIDDDCDGAIDDEDDDLDAPVGFVDADGDGYTPDTPQPTCHSVSGRPTGDCDDANLHANPGELERCDGFDNDCDGNVDDDQPTPPVDAPVWFVDNDADTFGSTVQVHPRSCVQPPSSSANDDDCDDNDGTVQGPHHEIYYDLDHDGSYSMSAAFECELPVGQAYSVDAGDDCNDLEAAAYPGALERCDGIDNDCDGLIDGADTLDVLLGADVDDDGFGSDAVTTDDCSQLGSGWVSLDLGVDCDDAAPLVFPDAHEDCNGVDDDCDSDVDEGVDGYFDVGAGAPVAWSAVTSGDTVTDVLACGEVTWDGTLTHAVTLEATGATIRGRLEIGTGGDLDLVGAQLEPGVATGLDGGALSIVDGQATLTDVVVDCANQAHPPNQGGAIAADAAVDLVLAGTTIEGCGATLRGGAIWARDTAITLDATTLFRSNDSPAGGALYLEGNASASFTAGATMERNTANSGGAVYLAAGSPSLVGAPTYQENEASLGGAVFTVAVRPLGNGIYRMNGADLGGALYVQQGTGPVITGTFQQNGADVSGGAIYVDSQVSDLEVSGSFDSNYTGVGCVPSTGSECSGSGGAIYTNSSLTLETGISFTANAAGTGGAIYASDHLVLDGATFAHNRATVVGGAIAIGGHDGRASSDGGGGVLIFDANAAPHGTGIAFQSSYSLLPGLDLEGAQFTGDPAPAVAHVLLEQGSFRCQECASDGAAVEFGQGGTTSVTFAGSYLCDEFTETCMLVP